MKSLALPALIGSLFLLLPSPAAAECGVLKDQSFRPLAGKEKIDLCREFEGDVLLVVNTASKCGFTPQYEGLEKLHANYADKGFAVVGFPSNDFMGQEPGTEEEIKEFCTLTYGVKFPMFEKTSVKEGEAAPFYQTLAKESGGEYPAWNFHKYLVGRDGRVIKSFGSRTKPEDDALAAEIEKALAEPKG